MTINLTLRGEKGTTLTYQEVDTNFTNLRDAINNFTPDTSTYVTTSSLATQLSGYVTTGSLTTQLAGYATTSSLNNYVLTTTLDGYVTTATSQSITGTKTFRGIQETVYAWGNVTGTLTPNASSGTIQTMTLTGNITISALSSPAAGQSVTLKLIQDATGGRTLTSTMKFAGASKTLSTASNAIDILNITYDGTDYLASLIKGFA